MRNRTARPKGKSKPSPPPKGITLDPKVSITSLLDAAKAVLLSGGKRSRPPLIAPRKRKNHTQPIDHTEPQPVINIEPDPLHDFSDWVLTGNAPQPKRSTTIKDLASVVYDIMDDITKAQATAIARVVKQGYDNDKNVPMIAKELQKRLDFDEERALVIAQTELTRIAAADGLIEAGKKGNKTVRFDASGDPCPICQGKNGKEFSIKDAQHIIPVHPHCRCRWADPLTGNVFCPTGKGGGIDPTCKKGEGGRVVPTDKTKVRTKYHIQKVMEAINAGKRQSDTTAKSRPVPGAGSGRVPARDAGSSRGVEGKTGRPDHPSPSGTGVDRSKPARPNPSRIAATADRVNAKIDRVSSVLRSRGQHEVAGWLDKLKEHVSKVGVPAALEQLGGTGKKRTGKIQYEGGWDKDAFDHTDPGHHLAAFCESYLDRHGITMTHTLGDVTTGNKPLVSSLTPSQGGTIKDHPAKSDFLPKDPKKFTDKLAESKALPGLEKSEDVSKLLGKQVSHLTPEVHAELDKIYGRDKWIVKAYGDEAAAGYGIYFPQRSRQIAEDARNTIWNSGGELAQYGFSHLRDARGKITGIRHKDGKKYEFGSKEYNKTIDGHVREIADRVAVAAENEKGAILPKGGKEFMAQPAFDVVGISEADRAAGVTIKYGQEGRVHVTTRNGKVEIVPHATWLKGENLPVVFETEDTRAMAKAAQEAIAKFPHSERNGQIYAPDLVKTTTGYKMVEANPANHTGSSGYLGNNPLIIDSYVSHVSGREPSHVAFIRSLLTTRNTTKPAPTGNEETTDNVFCPTGKGGGIDPHCSPSEGGAHTSTNKDGKTISFVPHKQHKPDEEMILVSTKKLDTDYSSKPEAVTRPVPDAEFYYNANTESIKRLKSHIASGSPLESIKVKLDRRGQPDVEDGRHRLRVLSDEGYDKIAVSVPKSQADEFRRKYS